MPSHRDQRGLGDLPRLLVVSCMVATGAGCGDERLTITIYLGAVHDRSGPSEDSTRLDGFNLGIIHANDGLARSSYKNLRLETVVADGASDEALATQSALDLVHNYDVKAL